MEFLERNLDKNFLNKIKNINTINNLEILANLILDGKIRGRTVIKI